MAFSSLVNSMALSWRQPFLSPLSSVFPFNRLCFVPPSSMLYPLSSLTTKQLCQFTFPRWLLLWLCYSSHCLLLSLCDQVIKYEISHLKTIGFGPASGPHAHLAGTEVCTSINWSHCPNHQTPLVLSVYDVNFTWNSPLLPQIRLKPPCQDWHEHKLDLWGLNWQNETCHTHLVKDAASWEETGPRISRILWYWRALDTSQIFIHIYHISSVHKTSEYLTSWPPDQSFFFFPGSASLLLSFYFP